MYHIIPNPNEANHYKIAILIKESSLRAPDMTKHYVKPLIDRGITSDSIILFSLDYEGKRVSAKTAKAYLDDLCPILKDLGVDTILCCDPNYFKYLCKEVKVEVHNGYVMEQKYYKNFDASVIVSPNYQALIYDPAIQQKIDNALNTLAAHVKGSYTKPGENIIQYSYYPESQSSIFQVLRNLLTYPELSCDIEAFSLKFWEAGIGSMAFAWDEHHGIAFPVDYKEYAKPTEVNGVIHHGFKIDNQAVKADIRWFLENYKGKLVFHNANYDCKVLIYELWMDSLLDDENKIQGIETVAKLIEDTKVITYLATNSTAGNDLKLKNLAHEFAGNYAQEDIKDIRLIPKAQLLEYNLVDALATNYVKRVYYPKMVIDNQEEIYRTLMLPSLKVLLFIELNGMPMDMDQVYTTKAEFEAFKDEATKYIMANPIVRNFTHIIQEDAMNKANAKLKTKVKSIDEFADVLFKPSSPNQLSSLFYDHLQLPVFDKTDSGKPATGGKTIKKLINHLKSTFNISEEDLQ